MRPLILFFLLCTFIITAGQTGHIKKITLTEAISLAIRNNSNLKTKSEKVIKSEVKKAYFDLLYQINRFKALQTQADLIFDLERVANLRYEAGDIDLLEKTAMISRFTEIKTSLAVMQDEITLSGNQLKSLLLTSDDLIPVDSILSMYILQKEDAAFSVSDEGLTSDRANKTEELELELNQYFKQLQYFSKVALVHADLILEISRIRFEKEDIDYAEYTGNIDEAFRIRLEYLMTLNKYNQTAIELEFYAY
jgi:outer membrane protein TolC